MTANIRRVIGLAWLATPPLLLSALLHMADPDIDGWTGLSSHSVLWSVLLMGVLLSGCVAICFVVFLEYGRLAFLGASGLFAVVFGLLLAVFGSGATSVLGKVWTLFGGGGLVLAIVLAAVIPAVALGWPVSWREPAKHAG